MRWVLSLLALALLAGCTGSPVQNVHPAAPLNTQDAPAGNETAAPDPVANQTGEPPIAQAVLTADATNGTAPFTVNFTLAQEPDGGEPEWFLDADGDGAPDSDGAGLPANAAFTYEEPGNFTATLSIVHGSDLLTAAVAITVHAPPPPPPPPAVPDVVTQELDFSYEVGTVLCTDAPPAAAWGTPVNGVLWAEWEVLPETVGQTYTVTFTGTNPVLVIGEIAFYDADDARIEGSVNAGSGTLTGLVPVGAVHAMFVDCLAGPVSGHYSTAPTPPA